jgi:hypothetical protein
VIAPVYSVHPPYKIQIPPHVHEVLVRAPRRSRTAIERKLEELARLVAMRQWMEESEGQQPIRLQIAGYVGSYSLDPQSRKLTLFHLTQE